MKNLVQIILIATFLSISVIAFAQTSGGPDEFGYTWVNSLDPNGPDYNWIEPADDATAVTGLSDDNVVGPFSLGFDFIFYDEVYSQIWVQSNGKLTFTGGYQSYSNYTIPTAGGGDNFIAWFWDDLNPNAGTPSVTYENLQYNEMDAFMVSIVDYPEYSSATNMITTQTIICSNGDIIINYDSFTGGIDIVGATIGIENSDGTDGLEYNFNGVGGAIQDEIALKFIYPVAADNDLQALSLNGPGLASVGEEITFGFNIRNRGTIDQNDFSLSLATTTGDILATLDVNENLAAGASQVYDLSFMATAEFAGLLTVIGEVVLDTDETNINNTTSTEIYIQYDAQHDLAGQEFSLEISQSNYVTAEDSDDLNFESDDSYTLEAWVNPSNFYYTQGIISKNQNYNIHSYELKLQNGEVYFDNMPSGYILELNNWTHIVGVNDGGTRQLFINGEEVTLTGTPYVVTANTDYLGIGITVNAASYTLQGKLDEVRIWNTARTQEEIQQNMYDQITTDPEELVAYYPTTTGFGTSLYDNVGAHTGTMVGTPAWIPSSPFANLVGPPESAVGASTEFQFTVYNNGVSTETSYTINLQLEDGTVLATENISTPLGEKQSATHNISFVPTGIEGDVIIFGNVTNATDEVLTNNLASTTIYINPEHDLELVGLTGNPQSAVNNPTIFQVSVLCNGMNENNYQIDLKDNDDNILATENYVETILTSEIAVKEITWTPGVELQGTDVTVHATVTVAGDPLPENNDSPNFTFFVNNEHDMQAVTLNGNLSPTESDPATFSLIVHNNGVAETNYTAYIKQEGGAILVQEDITSQVMNSENTEIMLTFTPTSVGLLNIYGEVELATDEVPENNITSMVSLNVQVAGTTVATIGTDTETHGYQLPMNIYYDDSITQTIYFPDEIGFEGGNIAGISYTMQNCTAELTFGVDIYIGETEVTEFTSSVDSWINAEDQTLVFSSDNVVFPAGTDVENHYDFDAPYEYNGGNLVVTLVKRDDQYFSSLNHFYYTETPSHPNRTLYKYSDLGANDFDPFNPPAPYGVYTYVPNTQLFFTGMESGVVRGTITGEDGTPMSNVAVQRTGSSAIKYSDNDGYYNFSYVEPGTHTYTASKFGYYDVVEEGVVVTIDDTTYVDYTMVMLENVTVTGTVLESDTQNPAAGAIVTFAGYMDYLTTTDENGNYSIDGVYASHIYDVTVNYEGYQMYNGTADIGTDNPSEVPDIIVEEITYPPYNATAVQNEEDTEVALNWEVPNIPTRVHIGYNVYRFPFGYDYDETAWIQVNEATVVDTYFVDTSWNDVTGGCFRYGIKAVYTNGIESNPAITNWIAKNMQASVTVNVTTNDESSPEGAVVTLNATIPDPEGTYPQYSSPIVGNTVTFPSIYKTDYNIVITFPAFATSTTPVTVDDDFEMFDIMINELLIPVSNVAAEGNMDDTEVTITWNAPSARSFAEYQKQMGVDISATSRNQTSRSGISNNMTNQDRYVETYSIYRFVTAIEDDPTQWGEPIGTSSTTSYLDTGWADVDPGMYKYAIIANYTGDMHSPAVLSNWVGFGMFTTLNCHIESYYNNPIEGALVQLVGLTPDPEGQTFNYDLTSGADGNVAFTYVFRGNYTVHVTKEGFVPFSVETVSIQVPSSVIYQISEPLNPIAELTGEIIENSVSLSWSTPSGVTNYDFEDNNGGFTADTGWAWGTTDSLGAHSGTHVWVTNPNEIYENNANYSLISAPFTVQTGMNLEFYINYDSEANYDGMNCKISTDNGTSWTLINPIGGYPSVEDSGEGTYGGTSDGWELATFELGEYDGLSAQIKWNFLSDSSMNNYSGVAIDDVFLGAEVIRVNSRENDFARNDISKVQSSKTENSRALVGFNVYRNSIQIATDIATTTYLDENLEDGNYTYEITANYTTGESPADTISFAVYPVNVSTNVFGTDAPTVGLTDVYGILYNDEYVYETYSVDGAIAFNFIQGNQVYNFALYKPGYVIYQAEEQITVVAANIVVPDITLLEKANPPEIVETQFNGLETEVTVNWTAPVTDEDVFRHDDGEIINQIGFGASENSVLGSVYRNMAVINQIEWYLNSSISAHADVKLLVFALDIDGNPTTDLLYESEMVPNVDDEWNMYVLDKIIIAEYGFLVGISTPNVNPGLGCDDGVGDPFVFEPNTQLYIENYLTDSNWTDIVTYDMTYNLAVRAYGIDGGEIVYPESVASVSSRKEATPEQPETRAFEGYNVYRLLSSMTGNPATWTTVAENVTDTTATDITWFEENPGSYLYAVRSVHTNGVLSEAQFSPTIMKGVTPEFDIDFSITTGDENPATGTQITLTNQNGMDAYVYDALLPPTEQVEIEDIVIGYYLVTIELAGYDTHIDTILVDQNMNYEYAFIVGNGSDAQEIYNTALVGNYPNPFNPKTAISFTLANQSDVKIDIYNIKGQKIVTIANDKFEAGLHNLEWNGKDTNNRKVSSGMYFYKMTTEDYSSVKKMLMLK